MAGLADILAGGPLIGPEMQAQIYGQQAADPRVLASSSGPVGQAIGQLTATLGAAPRAMAAAQQLGAAQTAAMGDMGKYLSADDPIQAAAADTSGNPVARWAMLRSTPEQVAQMRLATAHAGLERAQTIPLTARGDILSGRVPIPGMSAPGALPAGTGGMPPALPGTTATPAAAPGSAAAGTPTIQGAGPDPLAGMPAAGTGRIAWLKNQPLAVQRLALARLARPAGAQ